MQLKFHKKKRCKLIFLLNFNRLLKSALGKIQDLIEQIEKEEVKAVVQNVSQKEVKSNDEEPKKGDKVAARVSGDNFWILASFVQVIDRNKYEVEDEDTEQLSDDSESHQIRKRYKLQKNRIIPLQKVFNDHVIFEKGSSVYAVFPETTCFYSAVIEKQPTQSSQFYQVRFEDDEDDNGNPTTRKVSFKYVLDSSLFK